MSSYILFEFCFENFDRLSVSNLNRAVGSGDEITTTRFLFGVPEQKHNHLNLLGGLSEF